MTFPIVDGALPFPVEDTARNDAWANRNIHMPEGFMSFKDDGIDECDLFCDDSHETAVGVGNTLETLLSGEGPFVAEANLYQRTGGSAPLIPTCDVT